jgi:hypothetical protein
MILGSDGQPIERKDCTVEVNRISVQGKAFSQSYIDWNLPLHMKRMIQILKEKDGQQMHYQEFLAEYKRRYPNE